MPAVTTRDELIKLFPGSKEMIWAADSVSMADTIWRDWLDYQGGGTSNFGRPPLPAVAPGENLTSMEGALNVGTAPAGEKFYLLEFSQANGNSLRTLLVDRLYQVQANATITTLQTINGPDVPNRGRTGGELTDLWLTKQHTNSGSPTWTITYTNSQGVTGRVATVGESSTTTRGNAQLIQLQSGDDGVRSIQSIQSSSAQASGSVMFSIARRVADVGAASTAGFNGRFALDGLPEVPDGAVLVPMVQGGTTTSGYTQFVARIGVSNPASAAFTGIQDILTALPGQRAQFFKTAIPASSTGQQYDLARITGQPPAMALPPTGAGEIPTRSTLGAIPFDAPGAGKRLHLARFAAGTTGATAATAAYDRLFHVQTVTGDTTLQTVNGAVVNRGPADGIGNELWWTGEATSSGTSSTLTVTYEDGTGVQRTTTTAVTANWQARRIRMVGLVNNLGVRRIVSYQFSSNPATVGTLMIVRRLTAVGSRLIITDRDAFDLGLPVVDSNACINLLGIVSSSTTPTWFGGLQLIEGTAV